MLRLRPGDQVVHEGPLENSGSVLLAIDRPVMVVNGRESSLTFGATFPEARDRFWDGARPSQEWPKPGRHFLPVCRRTPAWFARCRPAPSA